MATGLEVALAEVLSDFVRQRGGDEGWHLRVEASDPWHLNACCDAPGLVGLVLRSVREGDGAALARFGEALGEVSRDFFRPYPWEDAQALPAALGAAIAQSLRRVDATYVAELPGEGVIALFFLWKAGGNPHSQRHGVEVPELGVAVADRWHRHGLGTLSVRLLLAIAGELGADAVELTTDQRNEGGWRTYRACGFEYLGLVRNPLDVDVTAALVGDVVATQFRDERQMAHMLRLDRRADAIAYLAAKRDEANAVG